MEVNDKLNEIYEGMLDEKAKGQLVDLNIAGYKKNDVIYAIMDGLDKLANQKNLPPVDVNSVNSILGKLRFKKEG